MIRGQPVKEGRSRGNQRTCPTVIKLERLVLSDRKREYFLATHLGGSLYSAKACVVLSPLRSAVAIAWRRYGRDRDGESTRTALEQRKARVACHFYKLPILLRKLRCETYHLRSQHAGDNKFAMHRFVSFLDEYASGERERGAGMARSLLRLGWE